MTATTMRPAAADTYDPSVDVAGLPTELRSIIEAAILNQPRSLQKRIGPSELGMECSRCLTHKLAGTAELTESAAWLPFIGTCVHEELETIFLRHEQTRAALAMPHRFLPECRVTVGQVGGVDITGSTDLFDTHTGTVIDWKIVGTNTLRSVKANGASTVYRTQAMLYGKGWEAAGYTVTGTLIYFLPRNAVSLSDGIAWSAPYDRAVADQALARADHIHTQATHDLDAALEQAGPHLGTGFTCRRYPDFTPQLIAASQSSADPFGG